MHSRQNVNTCEHLPPPHLTSLEREKRRKKQLGVVRKTARKGNLSLVFRKMSLGGMRGSLESLNSRRPLRSVGIGWDTMAELMAAPSMTHHEENSSKSQEPPLTAAPAPSPAPPPKKITAKSIKELLSQCPDLMKFKTDIHAIPDNTTTTQTIFSSGNGMALPSPPPPPLPMPALPSAPPVPTLPPSVSVPMPPVSVSPPSLSMPVPAFASPLCKADHSSKDEHKGHDDDAQYGSDWQIMTSFQSDSVHLPLGIPWSPSSTKTPATVALLRPALPVGSHRKRVWVFDDTDCVDPTLFVCAQAGLYRVSFVVVSSSQRHRAELTLPTPHVLFHSHRPAAKEEAKVLLSEKQMVSTVRFLSAASTIQVLFSRASLPSVPCPHQLVVQIGYREAV